ncbi:RecB family exonuclease [Streptomyces buecherae]|uniref:PD-(D/E)XK nuclease family protein n=1 Tax=Streptomyces buecherae TaxID=2763006 RepID=A0A7H8N390_9ACTN|nr:PD-(D/E)XK nuclease family protein [Streptomyces buecherae]QKW48856.1 PD-(D/E)XK nuclease family protein [Streptomyces buecherae]
MSVETQPRSVSQVQQYEQCPHRFYLQRVERVVPRPAAWSHHGTAFHSAAEAFELSDREMSVDEAVQIFSERYAEGINESLGREPNVDLWLSARRDGGSDIEARYVLGQQQTRRYVEWAAGESSATYCTPDGRKAVELYFMVELGGVKVRGFIDQLVQDPDGSVRPRDWKTGTTKSRFQLETYGVATRKAFGVEVSKADWYLAKDGRLSRPVSLAGVTEQAVGERFEAMDSAVKLGNFPARPGFTCKFCDVSHACSMRN